MDGKSRPYTAFPGFVVVELQQREHPAATGSAEA